MVTQPGATGHSVTCLDILYLMDPLQALEVHRLLAGHLNILPKDQEHLQDQGHRHHPYHTAGRFKC